MQSPSDDDGHAKGEDSQTGSDTKDVHIYSSADSQSTEEVQMEMMQTRSGSSELHSDAVVEKINQVTEDESMGDEGNEDFGKLPECLKMSDNIFNKRWHSRRCPESIFVYRSVLVHLARIINCVNEQLHGNYTPVDIALDLAELLMDPELLDSEIRNFPPIYPGETVPSFYEVTATSDHATEIADQLTREAKLVDAEDSSVVWDPELLRQIFIKLKLHELSQSNVHHDMSKDLITSLNTSLDAPTGTFESIPIEDTIMICENEDQNDVEEGEVEEDSSSQGDITDDEIGNKRPLILVAGKSNSRAPAPDSPSTDSSESTDDEDMLPLVRRLPASPPSSAPLLPVPTPVKPSLPRLSAKLHSSSEPKPVFSPPPPPPPPSDVPLQSDIRQPPDPSSRHQSPPAPTSYHPAVSRPHGPYSFQFARDPPPPPPDLSPPTVINAPPAYFRPPSLVNKGRSREESQHRAVLTTPQQDTSWNQNIRDPSDNNHHKHLQQPPHHQQQPPHHQQQPPHHQQQPPHHQQQPPHHQQQPPHHQLPPHHQHTSQPMPSQRLHRSSQPPPVHLPHQLLPPQTHLRMNSPLWEQQAGGGGWGQARDGDPPYAAVNGAPTGQTPPLPPQQYTQNYHNVPTQQPNLYPSLQQQDHRQGLQHETYELPHGPGAATGQLNPQSVPPMNIEAMSDSEES
eukprot:GHVH01006969.1.p1 GENE.GHVH01006969.1~~GHVH01006969.1.p1  ORF type:complete len:681 (-),score=109.21 GHVH01006969.1:127-2169(-)